MNELSSIPSVNQLLLSDEGQKMEKLFGHGWTVEALREILGEIRLQFLENGVPDISIILEHAELLLHNWFQPTLFPVINASGVILHTNLGRAPLSLDAIMAVENVGSAYSTLEFDINSGKRGSRLIHTEKHLKRLSGAEAAMVVNNNAASVLLCLNAMARKKKVVIARTQLIEIGGGFRIPDVMKQSGAKLVEVGTTNRVHISDYRKALDKGAKIIMRAHHSNYKIIGFTSEPSLFELAELAQEYDVPLLDDLGSGTFLDTLKYGLPHEPTIQESLQAGADIVCFSGDKLLGGPQAGIIVGKDKILVKLKKHPLARAVRADKFCLAALNATLLHYLKDEAEQKIPIWKMISMELKEIQKRAEYWKDSIGMGEIIEGVSKIGGGSLPEEVLPTRLLSFEISRVDHVIRQLRNSSTPVIARTQDEKMVLDPRTVFIEQEEAMIQTLKIVLNKEY
ncbi:MAG: L-seryl-tRNA(Sec) selenium transferase [Anaerolineaceae bacterium]|nr:L-seryl-tRNA(Sec) selenium transferase [Anaerolineaceae bacterium]